MKYNALMYYGQKYFGFEELEMPACGENDMIVKNLTASICGSDTDTWLNGGELPYLPPRVEFGHEVVCEVVETGKNVTGVKPGRPHCAVSAEGHAESQKGGISRRLLGISVYYKREGRRKLLDSG